MEELDDEEDIALANNENLNDLDNITSVDNLEAKVVN